MFSINSEESVLIRPKKFLYQNQIINHNQFGFMTHAACIQLMNFIETNLDKRQIVGCFFVDISVQQAALLGKLENIGTKDIN